MKVNWKIRLKNPKFYAQIILAALIPILAAYGIEASEVDTWGKLFELIQFAYTNPFLLSTVVISVYNSINDPTQKSFISDSSQALNYREPKKEPKHKK